MVETDYQIELTASFLQGVDAIETCLSEAGAGFVYDALLSDLQTAVFPNLARFPRMGCRYLDHRPQPSEALAAPESLPTGTANGLREYIQGDDLILCTVRDDRRIVFILASKHHRQLSFDFARLWPPPI